ncbi:DUF1588 domain-containing protein [Akkermansiaceae bacterium]|nr:DUF1588 domain-containing protein [Akkermansiaceae bacterium]MDB4544587.1 DUF1588 domain-containing protein [Akkermansiaceae bacterium]
MVAFSSVPVMAIESSAGNFLENYCFSCHDEWEKKGGLRLDQLDSLPLEARLEVFNKIQEQLYFGQMPPKKKEKQPGVAERKEMLAWVAGELKKHHASTLEDKLRYPNYGNYVDHEKLFSGEIKEQPFTPSRRWLVSPQIFIERVNAIFGLDERARQSTFYGVTVPIILPDHAGVRYYDTTTLDGGHLLTMLTNADWISRKQLREARVKNGELKANEFENPKDKWRPGNTPEEFTAIVTKKSAPTEAEMTSAIHAQYQCVLQRQASGEELKNHLTLLKESIALGGNTEGLRQMLVSVLLKSEFMYRYEFGEGELDEHGRRKMSPREASYAIAYALSDHNPDAALVKAAEEGRLNSKEDYQREVMRLLKDKKSFFAEGDPTVNGIHLRSHKVPHPKINRFFREFFGYPNSTKVFKDTARSDGAFMNSGRGYSGTAGWITNEADKVVDAVLREDQNVFERLLTTDEFFVLHRHSNEEGAQIVAGWKKVWETLKETDWKKDPRKFLEENFEKYREELTKIKITKIDGRNNVRDLKRFMEYFEVTFGRGITPATSPWFYHGGQKFSYAEIYSLPKSAGSGPTGGNGKYTDQEYWDFPTTQPFTVPNRKGILTHPAWLVAHSQNTETDPVRRGKWIREKLLAGYVPDVPITVDAQIPEDHHRTLRERLHGVTSKEECWKCHVHMNPLGLTFEVFDDFGRYRLAESLEHPENVLKKAQGKFAAPIYQTKPVNPLGHLEGTGDPALDGEVKDAFELIDRLAKSRRVQQSIIRHAFRYFMGRNEMLSDSQTLIDAETAYVRSGGSFNMLILSLLTSDSFIYRKETLPIQ